jgi:hypothetical protein
MQSAPAVSAVLGYAYVHSCSPVYTQTCTITFFVRDGRRMHMHRVHAVKVHICVYTGLDRSSIHAVPFSWLHHNS